LIDGATYNDNSSTVCLFGVVRKSMALLDTSWRLELQLIKVLAGILSGNNHHATT